jgi:phosphoribosylglycinamide formyltransferase-1
VPKGSTTVSHGKIIGVYNPDLTCLSGWLFPVCDLETGKIINVHPGDTSVAGGPGKFGHHVHEAVMAAYDQGKVTESAISMHFVTVRYDEGPVFFRYPVAIRPEDTPESLATRVNEVEHAWQAYVTGLVLDGKIWYNALNGNVVVDPNVNRALYHFFPESVVVASTYP